MTVKFSSAIAELTRVIQDSRVDEGLRTQAESEFDRLVAEYPGEEILAINDPEVATLLGLLFPGQVFASCLGTKCICARFAQGLVLSAAHIGLPSGNSAVSPVTHRLSDATLSDLYGHVMHILDPEKNAMANIENLNKAVRSDAALQDSLRSVSCTFAPYSSRAEITHAAQSEGGEHAILLQQWTASGQACPYSGLVESSGFCSYGAVAWVTCCASFCLPYGEGDLARAKNLLERHQRFLSLTPTTFALGSGTEAQWTSFSNQLAILEPLPADCFQVMPWSDSSSSSHLFLCVFMSQVGSPDNKATALVQLASRLLNAYPLVQLVFSTQNNVVSLVAQMAALLNAPNAVFSLESLALVEEFFVGLDISVLNDLARAPSVIHSLQTLLKQKETEKKALSKADQSLKIIASEFEDFSSENNAKVLKIVDFGEPQYATRILYNVMCQNPRTALARLIFHLLRLPKGIDCPIPLLDRLIKWVLRHRAEYLSMMVLSGGNIDSYRGSFNFSLSEDLLQKLFAGKQLTVEFITKIASKAESFHHLKEIRISPNLSTFTECLVTLKTATSLMAAFGIMDSDLRANSTPITEIPFTSLGAYSTKNIFFGGASNMSSIQDAVASYGAHDVPIFVKHMVRAGIEACGKTLLYVETSHSVPWYLPSNVFAGDGAIHETLRSEENAFLYHRDLQRNATLCNVPSPSMASSSMAPPTKKAKNDKRQNTIQESADGKTLSITSNHGTTYAWDAKGIKEAIGSRACHFVACSSLPSSEQRRKHCPNPHCKLDHHTGAFPAGWFENKTANKFRKDPSL